MTRPPASGTCRRTSVRRVSAAASTAGIHDPAGSSAVRSACACRSLVSGSPSRAATSSPARVRQLHLAGVGHEQHRPDDVVGQRVGVAVGVVGHRARDPVVAGRVGDERDRVDVGAERRAGQREPPGGRLEGLAHPLAPRHRVAGVVDLVEDHQRLEALGADPHRQRVDRDPGVGHRDPDEVLRGPALAGGVRRVDRDAGPGGGLGPLGLEVLGGRDDGDPVDDAGAPAARRRPSARRSSCRRPGVATARKSRGLSARYRSSPPAARRAAGGAVPQAARSGQRGTEQGGTASGRPVTRRSPGRRRLAVVTGLHELPDLLALRAHRELLGARGWAPRPCRTGR